MFLQSLRLGLSGAFCLLGGYFFFMPPGTEQGSLVGLAVLFFILALLLWVPWRGLFITYLHHRYENGKGVKKSLKSLIMLLPAIRFYHNDVTMPNGETPPAHALKMLALNAYEPSGKIAPKADFILAQNPDIAAVSEVNKHWQLALKNLKHIYPHQRLTTARDSHRQYKMLLLSKYPVSVIKTRAKGRVVHYRVQRPEGDVHLVQVHPQAPLTPKRTRTRNQTLEKLAGLETDLPVVILGDFNCVPWQKPVRHLIENRNLRLAGLPSPTYPASQKINRQRRVRTRPLSPFDYILIPDTALVYDVKRHEVAETDHFAVSAVLSL